VFGDIMVAHLQIDIKEAILN